MGGGRRGARGVDVAHDDLVGEGLADLEDLVGDALSRRRIVDGLDNNRHLAHVAGPFAIGNGVGEAVLAVEIDGRGVGEHAEPPGVAKCPRAKAERNPM